MSHVTFILSLGPLCPWLLLLLALQVLAGAFGPRKRGWPRLLILALVAAGLLQIPIKGVTVAEWVCGIIADFSIPFTGLLAVAGWEGEFQTKLFSRADWTAAWAFGAVAGLGLYPLALGWGSFDPYEWGWGFSALFVIAGGLTALLLWKQNRFGLLLLLAVVAYQLRLLESANYWDCLLDPVYCIVSLLALATKLIKMARPADGVRGP
jgi:hypothetical protein